MKQFKDANGKSWQVVIDVSAMKRVRDLTGVNLYSLVDEQAKPLGALLGNPVQLVDVLYVLCKEQADAANVSDETFGRSFNGDVLEAATDAFLEELFGFFPKRQRETLAKMKAKASQLAILVNDEQQRSLDNLDLELLAKKLKQSSTDAPASSACTLAT